MMQTAVNEIDSGAVRTTEANHDWITEFVARLMEDIASETTMREALRQAHSPSSIGSLLFPYPQSQQDIVSLLIVLAGEQASSRFRKGVLSNYIGVITALYLTASNDLLRKSVTLSRIRKLLKMDTLLYECRRALAAKEPELHQLQEDLKTRQYELAMSSPLPDEKVRKLEQDLAKNTKLEEEVNEPLRYVPELEKGTETTEEERAALIKGLIRLNYVPLPCTKDLRGKVRNGLRKVCS
jgi:hypothetical protein